METTKITRGAAELNLGGAPTRPNFLPPVHGAFSPTAAPAAAVPQVASAPAPVTGNPTHDGPSADLLARRASVESIRAGLAAITASVATAKTNLVPILTGLLPSQAELVAGEHFDPQVALDFINAAAALVSSLSAPAPPAPTAVPTPAPAADAAPAKSK